jgi:hypothetical protein
MTLSRIKNTRSFATIIAPVLLAVFACFLWQIPEAYAFLSDICQDHGGHLRLRGSAAYPEKKSFLYHAQGSRLLDASFEFRSKHKLLLSDQKYFDLHYELIGTTGDTTKAVSGYPGFYPASGVSVFQGQISDDHRLMDLTHVITSGSDYKMYHRLDRLSFTWRAERAMIRAGRQALTWGNGFLFHPLDLFNPFSPMDVERDYKIGDDMIVLQTYAGSQGNLEMLLVPRRNPENRKIRKDQSSAAAKYHGYAGCIETDLMAAIHYDDFVAGLGFAGYVGGAAWRLDITHTWIDDAENKNSFSTVCANIDYSWTWWNKNFYGWIEYYYTGLGSDNYPTALNDPDIINRVRRNERFILGHSYLDAHLQAELHPLINFSITLIANTRDPSGSIQPRIIWDATQNIEITFGANIFWGGPDTEFGGFEISGLPFEQSPANSIYLLAGWFY